MDAELEQITSLLITQAISPALCGSKSYIQLVKVCQVQGSVVQSVLGGVVLQLVVVLSCAALNLLHR